MKLAISLASRGRPLQLVDTVTRSIANWTHPHTEMWIQLDHDDDASIDAVERAKFPESVHLDVRHREDTIAAKWNRVLSAPADVYAVAADDDPYVVKGYDANYLEAAKRFPDGVGFVYGHLANLSFPCTVGVTRKLADILGYMQPEHFPYWFCDHWTDDLARITGRYAFADIRTDQSKVGKTQEMREPGWWATFYDACYMIRRREAQKVLAHSKTPKWMAKQLLGNAPLVEQRSRGVNEGVRQQARQLEGWSGLSTADERYQRVKARAIEMAKNALADPEMDQEWRERYTAMLFPPTSVPALQRAFG